MILTVTPNPTIDRVLFVRDFAMQDMVRAEGETVAPSGKGIDVSALLHAFGVETLALGLSAGLSGDMLAALMDEIGAPYEFIPANGYTRVAALITDRAQGKQSPSSHTLTRNRRTWIACWRWRKQIALVLGPGLCGQPAPVCLTPTAAALGKAHGAVTLLDVPATACATAWPRCRISSRSAGELAAWRRTRRRCGVIERISEVVVDRQLADA